MTMENVYARCFKVEKPLLELQDPSLLLSLKFYDQSLVKCFPRELEGMGM
jgi:hypothetical protein